MKNYLQFGTLENIIRIPICKLSNGRIDVDEMRKRFDVEIAGLTPMRFYVKAEIEFEVDSVASFDDIDITERVSEYLQEKGIEYCNSSDIEVTYKEPIK